MLGRRIWRNLTGSMNPEAYKLMFAGVVFGFVLVYSSTQMGSVWTLIFCLFALVCCYGVLSLPFKLWRKLKNDGEGNNQLNLFSPDTLWMCALGTAVGLLIVFKLRISLPVIMMMFTVICGYGVCSLMIDWLLKNESESIKKLWKFNAIFAVLASFIATGSAHILVGLLLLCAGTNKAVKMIRG